MAFSLNGIEDEFEILPPRTALAREYYDKAKDGLYPGKRGEEIIKALELYDKGE